MTIDELPHAKDGVRTWNRTDNIGMQSQFELISAGAGAEPVDSMVIVSAP